MWIHCIEKPNEKYKCQIPAEMNMRIALRQDYLWNWKRKWYHLTLWFNQAVDAHTFQNNAIRMQYQKQSKGFGAEGVLRKPISAIQYKYTYI